MKTLIYVLLASCFSLLIGPAAAQPSAVASRLIVGLKLQGSTTISTEQAADFQNLNRSLNARQVRRLNGGRPGSPAVFVVELPASADMAEAIRAYQQSGLCEYVEADAQGAGGGVRGTVPNDVQYAARQWSLNNDGTFTLSPATAGADIKMQNAWDITHGDSTVTVAIIDSGCKLDHPEVAGRIWRNRQEIPGNNIDDDQNGYVDDVRAWNFAYNTNDPTDDQGHGSNVAGIIGANANNGIGFAGVNWGCKLMICKALNSQNNGFYSWWTEAIYYAVDNGARVINMSLGGSSTSAAMQTAVTYALQHNVTVVACMMNVNSNLTHYPAGLTGVIAVGATSPNDTRAVPFPWSATSGSCYGNHICLTAPGNYLFGLNHLSNTNYATYWSGTSQAAPHVAGVVSLMLTRNPALTPAQIRTILQTTADDQVGNPAEDAPGWDQYYGYGRLNAFRALSAVPLAARTASAPLRLQLYPNPASRSLTVRTDDARLLHRELVIVNSLGQVVGRHELSQPTRTLPLALAAGTYWVTVPGTGLGQALVVE